MTAMNVVRCSTKALNGSHDVAFRHVKPRGGCLASSGIVGAITMLLAATLLAATPALADAPVDRPEPNIERQLDRLERRGSVDPTTRRQLEDRLRRAPRGPERAAAERRLDRLPDREPPAERRPADPPTGNSLPSSVRPGFGDSGGGPGTGGHMVPPGGRSSGQR